MAGNFHHDDQGVSVIVGAMLLILITLAAAASLAIIVSQAEKKVADKQAYQAAVNSEELIIKGISPELNGTSGQASLDSLFITVQNANIDPSTLLTIYVNNMACYNYSLVSVNGIADRTWNTENWNSNYNYSTNYTIPGKSTVMINVNFTDRSATLAPQDYFWGYQVSIKKSITVKLLTGYNNYFNRTFDIPSAIANVKVMTQDLGNFKRDYLYMDGSESTSDDSIISWQWNILDQSTGNITHQNGKIVSLFPQSSGPFIINLTTADTNYLNDTSDDTYVPADEAFDPLAHIIPVQNGNNVTLFVTRMSNATMDGVYVSISPQQGDVLPDNYFGVTSDGGKFTFHVTGNGTLSITADSNAGSVTKTIVISSKPVTYNTPVANFTANATEGGSPMMVVFNDTSTNEPTSWQWNFGDGSANSSDRNVTHTFVNLLATSVNYTVNMTAYNSAGNTTRQMNITVRPTCPVANFSANETSGIDSLAVQFTDLSWNYPTTWVWDFGDSTTETDTTKTNPVHTFIWNPTYSTDGINATYHVKLTVTNNAPGSSQKIIDINVTHS